MAQPYLRSEQQANVVDLVAEGPIEGLVDGLRSIYLNNIPIINEKGRYNHKGVKVRSRKGTNTQTHIAGLPGVESETSLPLSLPKDTPITIAITDDNVDSMTVTFSIDQLYRVDDKGRVFAHPVEFKIEADPGTGVYDSVINKEAKEYGGITITNNFSNLITMTTGAETTGLDLFFSWFTPSSTPTVLVTYLDDLGGYSVPISTTLNVLQGTPPTYSLEYKPTSSGIWTEYATGTFPTLPTDGTLKDYVYSIRIIDNDLAPDSYDFRFTATGGSGGCFISGYDEMVAIAKQGDQLGVLLPMFQVVRVIGIGGDPDEDWGTVYYYGD